MSFRFRHFFLISAVVLTSAQPVLAEKANVTARPDYQGMWGSFDNGGGKYHLFAGLHEINGKVAVCGLIYFDENSNNTTQMLERKRSKHVQYLVDGRPLAIHTSDFIRYDSEAEARQANKAGCTVTRRDWSKVKKPDSFKLGLPSGGTFTY